LAVEAIDEADGNHLAPSSWQRLEKSRGRRVATAAKIGCKAAWRRFTPLLPHERQRPSSIDNRVIVGLTGIQACVADGELDFGECKDAEARQLTRYAVNELNGFPTWFTSLLELKPRAVSEVLSTCVEGEWVFPADRENLDEVLADLAWDGDQAFPLVESLVIELLRKSDPPNASILKMVLQLIANRSDIATTLLGSLAPTRISQYDTDSTAYLLWLSVWLQSDAATAIQFLQDCDQTQLRDDQVVQRLCDTLGAGRAGRSLTISNPSYATAENLRTLILLLHQHVRREDDVNRMGKGAYSRTSRDNAQQFRDGLFEILAQSEEPAADSMFEKLLDEPGLQDVQDWIAHLREKRIRRQADLPAWNPADIRSFAQHYEIDPKTDHDLFTIAVRRLVELKHDVEASENSLRDELRSGDQEFLLRRWLARKLMERSRNRYTVPQESEIDLRQRPDLRIETPATNPVSVEVKWADSWTLEELLERLENQLVGQYLRAHNVGYGIYVVGNIGKKQWWNKQEDSQHLSFQEVVGLLEKRAELIVKRQANVNNLKVVGIDFQEP